MNQHVIIGEGGFGCVLSPAVKASIPGIVYDDKLSKVGTKNDIESEYKKYRLVELADKYSKYYIGKPYKSDLLYSKELASILNKCKMFQTKPFTKSNAKQYAQLIMNYGGITLNKFIEKLNNMLTDKTQINYEKIQYFQTVKQSVDKLIEEADSEDKKTQFRIALLAIDKKLVELQSDVIQTIINNVEQMLFAMRNLFVGINAFLNTRVVHMDVKPENIIYDEDTHQMYFIDFGLMSSFSDIVKNNKNYKHSLNPNNPPEQTYYIGFNLQIASIETHYNDKLKYIRNHHDYLFTKKHSFNYETVVTQYKNMLDMLPSEGKRKLMDKSLATFDIYGLGYTIFTIFNKLTVSLGQIELDVIELCKKMMNWNVFDRITIKHVIVEFDSILMKHGLFAKYEEVQTMRTISNDRKSIKSYTKKSAPLSLPRSPESQNRSKQRSLTKKKRHNSI